MDQTKISKLLAYVLRHNPSHLDLEMMADGWVSVSDLLERFRVRKGIYFAESDLRDLVENDPKQRYALREDGYIRANQGHSLPSVSVIDPNPVVPPEILYHGTTEERWAKIKDSGRLSKMNRHHVHLSADYETALSVAKRHKKEKPLVLKIESFQMFLEQFRFYVSENNVWLVEEVPVEYLSIAKKPVVLS